MTSKGLFSVSVFAASILLSNLSSSTASSFDWDHTPVIAGAPVTVRVTAAPCHPVKVFLYVDGQEIEGEITEIPGQVTLNVPAGTDGEGYTIEVRCPTERDTQGGVVM